MKFQHHAAFSLALSGILYMIFKSWGLAIANFITGVFIDVDLPVDYWAQNSGPLKVKNFFQTYYENRLLKVRLLHGWEWLAFWSFAAWLTDWNLIIVGILIGFAQHIILDKLNYGESFLSYSLVWRWKKGFKSEDIFKNRTQRKGDYWLK